MDYFALADVILLIMLFFHRYMLRRLGLWKDATSQDTFSTSTLTTIPDYNNKTRPSVETIDDNNTPLDKKTLTKTPETIVNIKNL